MYLKQLSPVLRVHVLQVYDSTVEPRYNGHLGPIVAGCYIEVAVLLSGIQNHHN